MTAPFSEEVLDLAADQLAGAIDAVGLEYLEAVLRRSPEDCARYVEYLNLHAYLALEAEGLAVEGAGGAGAAQIAEVPTAALYRRVPVGATAGSARRWLMRVAVAAAVVLAFVAGISAMLGRSARRSAPHAPNVAIVLNQQGVVWSSNSAESRDEAARIAATPPGEPIPAGWIAIESGSLELEFLSGAQITLQGPAVFALNSERHAYLRRGHLTAYVPPQARGFTVGAPGCAVVDLGTRFDLDVNDTGNAKVRVLEGHVELHPDRGRPLAMKTGETRVFSTAGVIAPGPSVYDFNRLLASPFPGTPLDGQDGWVSTRGHATTLRSGSLPPSAWAFCPQENGSAILRRFNDAAFGFQIADRSTFTLEFDLQLDNTGRGGRVGLIDRMGDTLFEFGNKNTGGKPTSAWTFNTRLGKGTQSTDLMPTTPDAAYHLVATIDLAAHGGEGAFSLAVAPRGHAPVPVPGLQNVVMNLGPIRGSDFVGLSLTLFRAGAIGPIRIVPQDAGTVGPATLLKGE